MNPITMQLAKAVTHADTIAKNREAALAPLREAVNSATGAIFYGPLMRSTRSSSLKGEIGHGGRGEEIFQNQLDQILIERTGKSSGNQVTEAIVSRFANAAINHYDANMPKLPEYSAPVLPETTL